MSTDLKTTVATLVQAFVVLLGAFGVSIAPEYADLTIGIGAALLVAAQLAFGYFTNKK